MFEDSTFESTGRIKTCSRRWMIAAFALNGSALIALIIIPLIYPEALPSARQFTLMEAPEPPVNAPKPIPRTEHVVMVKAQDFAPMVAPARIPHDIFKPDKPEALEPVDVAAIGIPPGGGEVNQSVFRNAMPEPVVRAAPNKPVRISSTELSSPIYRVTPLYPAIARASRTQGTVVLQAIISKTGTIENLRVVNGPTMLQQAAIDAVKQWRYRPFLLNGDPMEVETTINVVFTLGN